MNFGPGVAISFKGEPPTYKREPGRELWHCPKCDVTTPAGIIPFPHRGCPPGTIIESRTLDWGDDCSAVAFDWPPNLWEFAA